MVSRTEADVGQIDAGGGGGAGGSGSVGTGGGIGDGEVGGGIGSLHAILAHASYIVHGALMSVGLGEADATVSVGTWSYVRDTRQR